jgi:methyl-accepting chemotaxis protein
MMQSSEINQRFTQIERNINQAAQACQSDNSVPQELRDYVRQLDQQSDQAKQALQSQDENRIRQSVDDLEQLGDRAEKACQRAGNVKDEIKNAVKQAHSALSDLKQQLH